MAPAAHTDQTPASGDIANGNAITTGVRFIVSAQIQCGGVAWWVPTTNTGTYTLGLYQTTADDVPENTGTGTLLSSTTAAAASVAADRWAEALFSEPVTLSTGVVYTAARHASSGRYVATTNGFNGTSISGNDVTLLASGTNPNPPDLGAMRNGMFVEGADLAYPVSFFNLANYFVDIVIAEDANETALAATLPALAATAAAIFNEPRQPLPGQRKQGVRAHDTLRTTPTFRNRRRRR